MKRKVVHLAVAVAKQLGKPWCAGYGRQKAKPCGQWSSPLEWPHYRQELW
jgi:hypothetical protein